MKKEDFVKLVKEQGGYNTNVEANTAINAFIGAITEALEKREDVSLIGFGSFSAALQKGKTGKIPGTDKTYTTQDKMVPKFKAGKNLSEKVAAGK